MGVLTFALISLYLWLPAGLLGWLAGGSAHESEALIFYVPFVIACCLGAFAILVFWSDAGTNRCLSADEKRKWRWALLLGWPIAGPLYWSRFR